MLAAGLALPAAANVAVTGIEKKSEGTVVFQGIKLGATSGSGAAAQAATSKDMDEDCVYIAVNDDKQEGVSGSSLDQIALAEETSTDGVYCMNAYLVVDRTDDTILAVVYDANNNRLDGDDIVDADGHVFSETPAL